MISGNLFTRDYLLEGIERTPQWKAISASEFSELQKRLSHIAHGFLKIAKPNEAETEKEFIYPVLEALGWSDYQVQQILSPNYAWYEIQDSSEYYPVFDKPKIIYQAIQFHPRYSFDATGAYTSNKTFVIAGGSEALAGILNSPLMWWFSWRHFVHMKDEALSNDGFKMETLPVSLVALKDKKVQATAAALGAKSEIVAAKTLAIIDWLSHEYELKKPKGALRRPELLNADGFVAAVRANLPKRKFTATEISDLKREHAETVEPARAAFAEISVLERALSDSVNSAYGLTAEEVDLMWKSAPPRMPFIPPGYEPIEDGVDGPEEDDDE